MKTGFKSRIWGIHLDDIRNMLDVIAEAGYRGVEFSQRPESLGVKDIEELMNLMRERNLALLSFTCGTLSERMKFCGGVRPEYLYLKHWDLTHIPSIVQQGFTPALHPGAFTPIRRITDALPYLEKYPNLKLLCDTAHMTIAGDDLVKTIQYIKDRLIGVHLKDWTPEFGRSGPRYGRGFTELGRGIVKLGLILEELLELKYDGWLVVEIEKSQTDQANTVLASAEWLAEKGVLTRPHTAAKLPATRRTWAFPRRGGKCPPEAEARFREAIMFAATSNPETFYWNTAEAFNELIPCNLVTIWACSPAQDQMGLLVSMVYGRSGTERGLILKPHEVLTGIAIDRQAPVTHFDLAEANPGQRYGYPDHPFEHPDLLKKIELKRMVTIPIYNSDNQNYVRLVVNLFPRNEMIPITDEEFYWLGKAVTVSADIMLDSLCSSAAVQVNLLASQCEEVQAFLENLRNLIQESLRCSGVAIFLVNEGGDRLELVESTGTNWLTPADDRFYRRGEGLTGRVWERNEPLLTVNSLSEPGHKGKSDELVPEQKQHACLWVPFVDSKGKVIGVIRCRNKRLIPTSIVPNMFSDDDVAVLDAIGQAAVPHMQILLDKERRAKALGRLTHELKVPLVAIRGAADSMLRTKGVDKFFDYDYPGDVWSWSELMRRLLGNADLFRYSSAGLPIRPTQVLLRADIIAPAVKQVRMLLNERGFSLRNITYEKFEEIPRLWIDQNQFQQVMFNLLSNAIKHCFNDPNSFQVEIDGRKQGREYLIHFRDWGPGIASEMKEAIFEEGVRTPEAMKRNITGQGLGLWVVRQVIQAHSGRIEVTNTHLPTEFTIYLSESLASRPPSQRLERRR